MTGTATPPPLSGQIVFDQFFAPPLESGDYEISVQQQVGDSGPASSFNETFGTTLAFAVKGPRFLLPPGYISQVFPPPGAQGEYSAVLPHVVSPVKTLPWQRPAQAKEPATRSPWLALLTFDQADPPPPVVSGTIADLQSPGAGVTSYPDLGTLEYGERSTDPVRYIDVDSALFSRIAPALDELAWLTHARTLDGAPADRKANGQDGSTPATEFSAVMSNRLPAPGNATTCYMVSVEGLSSVLPPAVLPAGKVRLAVLFTWSFGSVPQGETFREFFENLNDEPHTLQVPYAPGPVPAPAVQAALGMGYVAVSHHTRRGARTVSWYRGPLVPFANPPYLQVPASSSDALTRYDPQTGMFDVSLAAAWQLGQLLALADKPFSTALYRWKRGETQKAVVDFERTLLGESIGVDPALISRDGVPAQVQLMREVFKPVLATFLNARRGGSR